MRGAALRLQGVLALALVLQGPVPAQAWGWLTAPPETAPSETGPGDLDLADPARDAAAPTGAGRLPVAMGYGAAHPPSHGTDRGVEGLCLAAILQAEQRYGIPDNLLLALGLQEAGYKSLQGLTVWPWTVNAAGEGRRFSTRVEAEDFVRARQAAGVTSIDIGCLQINLRWHPEAFASLSQGFEPYRNVDYAARYLSELYYESGDWWLAAGRYHSRSAGPQEIYLGSLQRNHQVARARLGQFLALAEAAAGGYLAQDYAFADATAPALPQRKPRTPTPYRTEGAIWGADLSGAEGGRRSLYSALDLEPILPAFLPPET